MSASDDLISVFVRLECACISCNYSVGRCGWNLGRKMHERLTEYEVSSLDRCDLCLQGMCTPVFVRHSDASQADCHSSGHYWISSSRVSYFCATYR